MRRSMFACALAIATTAFFGTTSHPLLGQSPDAAMQVDAASDEVSGVWFVELSGAPTADGATEESLQREEADFHAAAAAAGATYTEGRRFRKLWNGLTVRADARNLAKLRTLPGVRAVYPVMRVDLAQDQPGNETELVTAIAQTGVDVAQNSMGLTGRGIRVAVMDTGIDFDHPDLGGCFGRGCRVERGYDFVGDAFNADPNSAAFNPVPTPDPIPDDCEGHGTHVAGIVGANGTIKGVAPDVTFHAYRVFGCAGSTTSDIMLAAMEMAHENGADILNMSIGSAYQWPQYPTAVGADRLVRQGMVVVTSIGNSGANGLYSASAPGVGRNVIGVASFDNTHANLGAISVSPDGRLAGYNPASAAPPAPQTGTLPMARTGTPTSTADACNGATAPAPGSLAGRAALIRRGTCSFYEKALNAQNAGAAAVILFNNAAGRLTPTVAGAQAITIPVVMITAADGVAFSNRIAAGPVDMTWTDRLVTEPQATANLISSFSSYGMAPDLSLKPDIGAPGGNIRSTIPVEKGAYGPNSGTSMASPHVAGAVALLMEGRPYVKAREVRDLLQNNATPRPWFGNPALGFLDNVHRQGAGMLRIDEAILADAIVSPAKLALGEIESGTVTERITIRRDQPRSYGRRTPTVTYTLGHEPALATGANTFAPSFLASFASVSFDVTTVTLGQTRRDADVVVTFTPPANANARLFGGYITLTPSDGGPVLRVPYAGYNGDYQAITVLTPTPNGFPWLAKLSGTTFTRQAAGATYSLEADDIPYFLLHLDHQARALEARVVDVTTGEPVGFAIVDQYLPRNSTATTFFSFSWDGTVSRTLKMKKLRAVPDGTYRLEFSLLKALGDPANPAHVERWTSPNITIARPVAATP